MEATTLDRMPREKGDGYVDAPTLERFRTRLRDLADRRGRKTLFVPAGVSEANFSRMLGRGTRPIDNPGLFTVKAIADAAGESVGWLLGEEGHTITAADREKAREMIDWLSSVFRVDQVGKHSTGVSPEIEPMAAALADVIPFPSHADADGDFPPLPISAEDFIEKDSDAPRPLHAWVVPVSAEAAAGAPRGVDDILVPTTQLLNTFREVRDDRTHVIKIIGHSMHPVLRNGWKVLIDPAKSLFQPGKIVMVYVKDEGSTIGLLAKSGQDFRIVKRNPDYGGPLEIPLRAGEWYPVGTVTTIVEAPVEIE